MTDVTLDPATILAHLGVHDCGAITPVTGGRDTAIWRVEQHERTFALRVFRPEQEAIIEHEVRAMRTAAAGGIPVPALLAADRWNTRPVLLLEWCDGHTVAAELRQHPERADDIGVMCGEILARVHALPAPTGARSWLSDRGNVEPWLTQRLAATASPDCLVHLDFHPLNLLTDGQRITAVLDWTNARAGDPRADLARSISILRLDTGELSPHESALLRRYERGLRAGYGPAESLTPFLAWAAAYMLDDIRGRPDVQPCQIRRIERWRDAWTYRSMPRSR